MLHFRHPGQPHSLNEAFVASEINGIVAGCIAAEPADGETWIERKPRQYAVRACFSSPSRANAAPRWKCAIE
jgi:hypothetical protein